MSNITLFCLPCAGGSAGMYRLWQSVLTKNINVVKIELPGRGQRFNEPLNSDFSDAINDVISQLPEIMPTRYAFFGHSMGGLLAYGAYLKLHEQKKQLPEHLFISACASPTNRNFKRFTHLDTQQDIINDLKKLGGTPKEVFEHPQLLKLVVNVFSADINVCRNFNYKPHQPFNTPISIFAGTQDNITEQQYLAWQDVTTSAIGYHLFSGGHFYLQAQRDALLALITDKLTQPISYAC